MVVKRCTVEFTALFLAGLQQRRNANWRVEATSDSGLTEVGFWTSGQEIRGTFFWSRLKSQFNGSMLRSIVCCGDLSSCGLQRLWKKKRKNIRSFKSSYFTEIYYSNIAVLSAVGKLELCLRNKTLVFFEFSLKIVIVLILKNSDFTGKKCILAQYVNVISQKQWH